MMLALTRPKAVMPIHGEFRMLAAHARLARDAGVREDQIIIGDNGTVLELSASGVRVTGEVETGMTFVDGLNVGDIGDVALRDRRHLSEDGVLIIVATISTRSALPPPEPELIARGFAGGEPLLEELREEAGRILTECLADGIDEIKLLQEHLHDGVGQHVYDRSRRRPMILPVVVEV